MVDYYVKAGLSWVSDYYHGQRMTMMMEEEDSSSNEDKHSHDDTTSLTEDGLLEENYFSQVPLDSSSLGSVDEIEAAIEKVKSLVLETEGVTEERRALIKRLVSLRIRLQDVREIQDERSDVSSNEELRIVSSHHFLVQGQLLHRSPQYCDRCSGVIWTILQSWYRCSACQYQCHSKCLNNVVRKCPALSVSIDTPYIPSICPEVGLPDQNYSCYECKTRFTMKNSWMEPRKCDYNGRYYCPSCHKNYTSPIPARILHNWDFGEKPVAEASRQFLTLMAKKPNINLDKVNSKLFSFVEDLNTVKRFREDILIMKEYFMTCRVASAQKLLRRLEEKQHFVENSTHYSLQDLIDAENGKLLNFLTKIHSDFVAHIKEECQVCRGKGFICEICENTHPIFAFESASHLCPKCYCVYHAVCFAKRESCPKCLRISRRRNSSNATSKST